MATTREASSSSCGLRAAGRRFGPRASDSREVAVLLVLAASTALCAAFLALPLVALFLRIPPGVLLDQLASDVAREAILVTLKTTPSRTSSSCSSERPPRTCSRRTALPRASCAPGSRRASARAAAGRRGDRAARGVRHSRPARRVARGARHLAPVHPGGGRGRDRVRREPLLHPPGDRRVRGRRSTLL